MKTQRAILVGAVDSSRVALDAIARHPEWDLAAVVTLDPAHEGRHSDFADLREPAAAAGSPVIHVGNVNGEAALEAIGRVEADYLFVVGWSQICGPAFRALLEDRVIGYHPAALPRLRGRAAIPWTILNREPITAGTLFWIDAGTDTGALLDQEFFHVAPDETAATLYARHMDALATMLDRSLSRLARGEAPRRRQDEACATWAARRTPEDGRIDWSAPAEDVMRLIRAAGRPYPGAFTSCAGEALTIWSAQPRDGGPRHLARPGQVVEVGAEGFCVMCGDRQLVAVTEWSGGARRPRQHEQLGEWR